MVFCAAQYDYVQPKPRPRKNLTSQTDPTSGLFVCFSIDGVRNEFTNILCRNVIKRVSTSSARSVHTEGLVIDRLNECGRLDRQANDQ